MSAQAIVSKKWSSTNLPALPQPHPPLPPQEPGEETRATSNCFWTRIIFRRSIDIASPGLADSVLEHPCAPADRFNFPLLIKERPTRGKGWRKISVLRRMDWNWQERKFVLLGQPPDALYFPSRTLLWKNIMKSLFTRVKNYILWQGNPAYSWIFPMIDRRWVWEGEVQTNNIENIICCSFSFPVFYFIWAGFSSTDMDCQPPNSQHLRSYGGCQSWGRGIQGSAPITCPQASEFGIFWGVFSLGENYETNLLSLTLIGWTWNLFHLSQVLVKFNTVFPLLLSHCLRSTHNERKQWKCDIRPSSLWLLIAQAGHVLMKGETLEDTLLFVYLFLTQLQSDGGAASQLLRRPYSASQTAVPFCQFRNRETFLSVLFSIVLTTRRQFGSNQRKAILKS